MFEHHKQPLIKKSAFIRRLARSMAIASGVVAVTLFSGMCGYHYIEGFAWTDAFLEAAMIFSGMGPVAPLHSHAGKLFAGSYALFCAFALIVPVTLVLIPIIHRLLHKFHIGKDLDN